MRRLGDTSVTTGMSEMLSLFKSVLLHCPRVCREFTPKYFGQSEVIPKLVHFYPLFGFWMDSGIMTFGRCSSYLRRWKLEVRKGAC